MKEGSEEGEEEEDFGGDKEDYTSLEACNYLGCVMTLIGSFSGDISSSLNYC